MVENVVHHVVQMVVDVHAYVKAASAVAIGMPYHSLRDHHCGESQSAPSLISNKTLQERIHVQMLAGKST